MLQDERGRNLPLLGTSLPSQDHSCCVGCSFVDIYPVILTHSNSSEGHRVAAVPLALATSSRIHLGDRGKRWVHTSQLHRPRPEPEPAHSQVCGSRAGGSLYTGPSL